MVKIEKNIPRPGRVRKKYPFAQMEIGDSFLVTIGSHKTIKSCQISLLNSAKKVQDMGFSTSIVSAKTVRIWRVK